MMMQKGRGERVGLQEYLARNEYVDYEVYVEVC